MKVICSGMQKTGTKTMASALRTLGYDVYDFEEQYFYLGDEFTRIGKNGWTTEDIQRIYKDVEAVTDGPSNSIWEEILEVFPDAKVSERCDRFVSCIISCHMTTIIKTVELSGVRTGGFGGQSPPHAY